MKWFNAENSFFSLFYKRYSIGTIKADWIDYIAIRIPIPFTGNYFCGKRIFKFVFYRIYPYRCTDNSELKLKFDTGWYWLIINFTKWHVAKGGS